MKYKAVIVEDEINAQEALVKMLTNFIGDIEVIQVIDNVKDAVRYIKANSFDILFLDIELIDGLGMDVLDQVSFKGHVIFTTAYDNYAIEAIKREAFDYLLKPISIKELRETLKRLESKKTPSEKTISLTDRQGIHIVKLRDIVRCEADKNYTTFIFTDANKLVISKTMGEFETFLESNGFMRVQKSHIINLKLIDKYIKSDGGKLQMKNGDLVKVSPLKKEALLGLIVT